MNLKGGPATDLRHIPKWRQKSLIGMSLKMVAPAGQHDPTKLINHGGTGCAFKPYGLSQRWGHWLVDAYGAWWFFTTNLDFFSLNQVQPGRYHTMGSARRRLRVISATMGSPAGGSASTAASDPEIGRVRMAWKLPARSREAPALLASPPSR